MTLRRTKYNYRVILDGSFERTKYMTKEQLSQLGKTLWTIADDLRGAMNADDFCGQISVPPGYAVGAVVQCAPGHGAVGAVLGLDKVGSAHGAGNLHGGQARDTAVAAVGHDLPGIVAIFSDTYDGHPVAVDLFKNLVCVALIIDVEYRYIGR